MDWTIEYAASALRQLKKMDQQAACRIVDYLEQRVICAENPRNLGKPLKGPFSSYWRFRVGDYRLICDLQDEKLVVLVLRTEHRKNIYRR